MELRTKVDDAFDAFRGSLQKLPATGSKLLLPSNGSYQVRAQDAPNSKLGMTPELPFKL